jgi:TonB family protein
MKTKMISLMIAGLILFIPAFASNNVPEKSTGLGDRIRTNISYPAVAYQKKIEGLVLVSFTVDSNGAIRIDGVNASNSELRDYVLNTIRNTKILPSDNVYGKSFNMRFVFRLI